MASLSSLSDSPPRPPVVLPFSETLRKVDCAVARLEELQGIVRTSRSYALYSKRSPSPPVRSKLALHAGEPFPNSKGSQKYASSSKPALPNPCVDRKQNRPHTQYVCSSKPNGGTVAMSRRSAKVADIPPPHAHKQVISSATNTREQEGSLRYGRTISPPSMSLSSPPSSACSSSAQVVTRTARLTKDMVPSECPRACSANVGGLAPPNVIASKPPRTFFVHAGRANPNRPWCLSSSPSPAANSSTTSNYIYSPSSNSSVPLPTKSPSRFSPLHRQISGKRRDSPQMQPLLCRSPEIFSKRIKASPNRDQGVPWFSQARIPLPSPAQPSAGTRRCTRRFSLASNRYQESPPRPLPALITRLPTRRRKASSPEKGRPAASPLRRIHTSRGSTPKASPPKVPVMNGRLPSEASLSPSNALRPLPLPPALQAPPSSTQHHPPSLLSSQKKVSHKRSSSCPRQSLLPLADSVHNCNLSPPPAKDRKRACFQCAGKENYCFSGCGLPAWPCLRRSWSFSHHRDNFENQNAGYMQNRMGTSSQSQAYKAEILVQESNRNQQKLYFG